MRCSRVMAKGHAAPLDLEHPPCGSCSIEQRWRKALATLGLETSPGCARPCLAPFNYSVLLNSFHNLVRITGSYLQVGKLRLKASATIQCILGTVLAPKHNNKTFKKY